GPGMKKLLIAICLVALPMFAQQTTDAAGPAGTPASREDVLRLFTALRLEAMMNNTMTTVLKSTEELMKQSVPPRAYDRMTAHQRQALDDYLKRAHDRALKMYPVPEILEDFVPLYQRNFTKEDIDAAVAFYNSPAGTRLLDKQPKMMEEGMAIMMPK